ncbi:hypothetical protein FCIRC_874 [Fusarium circinatum]|uniref:F-box domain-containing protein n=1 Tax=Fusarium circinatum TaxID=48490 RepID=A0A8H5XAU5_FUSCI|nr:hypothetical protein FCIRC_874 [Fusarium circinatum]
MPIAVVLEKTDPREPSITRSLVTLTNTLCTISEQRCYDQDAQRRALAAIDVCRRKIRPRPLFVQKPEIKRRESNCLTESQTDMVSRLPTELYIMIINYIVDDKHGKSPEQMKVRARTLQSLASTCRIFQILCEEYLYTNPRSQRLWKNKESQWLLCVALAVEPRRAQAVRLLRCELWLGYFQYQPWLETLELCTNQTHLELAWRHRIARFIMQGMDMGFFLAACPKVTEFKYEAGFDFPSDGLLTATPEQMARFSQQYGNFAKQLCHLEVSGSFECIRDILHYDYANLKSCTLDMDDDGDEGNMFQELSRHTPGVERLRIEHTENISLQDLEIGCKAWGKTLRSLDINSLSIRNPEDDILAHVLPHLTTLEELCLGPRLEVRLSDIHAIAKPDAPRLKAFRWEVDEAMFRGPFANSGTVNHAIIDILTAHSETLSTFIVDQEFDFWNFGTDIFKHLHKAKSLESLRVPLHDIPTKEEIQGLITACPKLGKSDARLVVVREFLTECTLRTINYKEDNLEVVESSWGSVRHPMRWT